MTYDELVQIPVEDCARNGATILDEILPGWEKKIDLERYRHLGANECILGQLGWHLFEQVREKSPIPAMFVAEFYGFLPLYLSMDSDNSIRERYERQELAWRFEIAKRLAS